MTHKIGLAAALLLLLGACGDSRTERGLSGGAIGAGIGAAGAAATGRSVLGGGVLGGAAGGTAGVLTGDDDD